MPKRSQGNAPPPSHIRNSGPFRARKRFGQHFLHDRHVIGRIISAIGVEAGEIIVEIGPGRGALTRPLLARAEHIGARLHAVELDRDLAAGLAKDLAEDLAAEFGFERQTPRFSLHTMDALAFDFTALTDREHPLRIVGNLPYNISTPLLFHLFSQSPYIRDMHIMLQRELADRMVASPGSPNYGRLSVMAGWHCLAEKLFDVGSGAFSPPPRVTSSVARLTMRQAPPMEVRDPAVLEELVRRVFSHRRKTLRKSLAGWLTQDEIRATGVDPGARPETLTLEQFAGLSNMISNYTPNARRMAAQGRLNSQ